MELKTIENIIGAGVDRGEKRDNILWEKVPLGALSNDVVGYTPKGIFKVE